MTEQTRAIPEGFHSVTPHLVVDGAAAAIDFYKQAFGAIELGRMDTPDGKIGHAEIRIGNSRMMLADAFPDYGSNSPLTLKGSPVVIHLYVENADAVWDQALAAGARPTMPLADAFWGDRYGQVEDPFGHRWSIATHQRDVSEEEMRQALENMRAEAGEGGQP